ncbi:transglycosylase SLT domain-containing protein [Pseudohoeflea sp. DP4N28-3]|uniref:Transglycosylase SLT domain-containing protein n=2 Tax=Pseudohoeflea coraliihabitans TaxID=2860393 RepID=A0ABS6WN25_9HYPH|nr:transglycosylase SLT domain-containing protein [Pseudohoeflea sp. DP4N28-3]
MGFISEIIAAPNAAAAPRQNACEAMILAAAAKWQVPAGILHSVGLIESGRRGVLHPYALNIAGRTVFAESRQQALREFKRARAQGQDLIDLGCMQINYHYHGAEFASPADMLDPEQNVDYAARFLHKLHQRHQSWTMAVARYHAGPDNDPAQRRYICRVIRNLVVVGHGGWTPQARAFCN